jgi:hypothetical protein
MKLRNYILTLDAKVQNLYKNTIETMHMQAYNLRDAKVKSSRIARDYNMKVVSVKLNRAIHF